MSVANFSFNLPPKAAMEYLAAKGQKLTFDYDEMMHDAHHRAFTVAKVTKLDLLSDIHESLRKAQAEGIPFEQWKKELKLILQKAGWWGETSVTNPATGEVRDIYVGSRRLRTIYYTNMRVSQSVGRYKEWMALPLSVYGKYNAIKDGKSRPSHLKLDGMVRHRDDPFWRRNYPPNDWNCRCFVTFHSKRECEKKGWKISPESEPLPEGYAPHPDWDYDVGAGAEYKSEQLYYKKTREVLAPYSDVTKKDYADNMKKLLPSKKEWSDFVDRSLPPKGEKHEKHEELRLGYLSMIVGLEEWLTTNPPESDLVLATTGSIANLRAKSDGSKKGKVLEPDEIKELHAKWSTPDEVIFENNNTPLLVWDFDNGKNKIVVGVDAGDKNRVFATIKSGQKYTTAQFEDFKRILEDRKK